MHFSYTNHVVVQNIYIYVGKREGIITGQMGIIIKKTMYTQSPERHFHEETHSELTVRK